MQKRLILKIESSPFRRGDKREGDYVSHSCLRRAIYTFGTSRHTPHGIQSHTKPTYGSCVEYKEAEVGRGLVDTKTQSEKERLNGI